MGMIELGRAVLALSLIISTSAYARNWNYGEHKDDWTKEVTPVAEIRGYDGAGIGVFCEDDRGGSKLQIWFTTGDFLRADNGFGRMKYKIDKDKTIERSMYVNSDSPYHARIQHISPKSAILAQLMSGESIRVGLYDQDNKLHIATFTLFGASFAIERLLKQCERKLHNHKHYGNSWYYDYAEDKSLGVYITGTTSEDGLANMEVYCTVSFENYSTRRDVAFELAEEAASETYQANLYYYIDDGARVAIENVDVIRGKRVELSDLPEDAELIRNLGRGSDINFAIARNAPEKQEEWNTLSLNNAGTNINRVLANCR